MASGAQQSRLAKAGGDPQAALAGLEQEYQSGAQGWSAAQKAAYENPATRDAWAQKQIGQSTKGKYSGFGGSLVKAIGKVAPLAGLIPGVGPLAGAAIGGIGRGISGGGFKGALGGAALGAGGSLLRSGIAKKGLGGLAGDIGKAISAPNVLGNAAGKIDLGKILGVAGGVSGLVGQNQQRKSAENYANANIAQRNMLLNRLLQPKDYALTVPNEG